MKRSCGRLALQHAMTLRAQIQLLLVTFLPSLAFAQGAQPSIVSVVFNPPAVAGGRPASAVITISAPAGNNGFEVSLSLTSNAAQLAASAVTIGSGQTSASVQVTTTPTSTSQLAALTATARGDTRTANLTINPPSPASLALAPASVTAGQQSVATITLDGAAPAGGTAVTLSSSSAAATVPSTATIAQGQTSRTVTLSTSAVSAQTNATITATAGSSSRTATLTIQPPPLSITSIGFPSGAKTGQTVSLTTQANRPVPAGELIVRVTSTGFDLFGDNSTMTDTIPAGQTSSSRKVTIPRTDRDKTFTLAATANGITTSRSATIVGPRIESITITDSVIAGQPGRITANLDAATSLGLPATLTSSSPAVSVAPATQGSSSFSPFQVFYRFEANPVAVRTPVTITVTNSGVTHTLQTVVVPGPLGLNALSVNPTIVRIGASFVLSVSLTAAAPSGGVIVELSVTGAPDGMKLPTSITVPAGATVGSFSIVATGRLISSAFPVIKARLGTIERTVQMRIDP